MRFSTRSRYGLRAIICIARNYPDSVACDTIAVDQKISKKYLDQILRRLRNSDILRTVKGKLGGYYLAKPPSEISLFDIITSLDGGLAPSDCVSRPAKCEKSGDCPARRVWCSVTRMLSEQLSEISLQDILSSKV